MKLNNMRVVLGGLKTNYVQVTSNQLEVGNIKNVTNIDKNVQSQLVLGKFSHREYLSSTIESFFPHVNNDEYNELKNKNTTSFCIMTITDKIGFSLPVFYELYAFSDTKFENPLFVLPVDAYIIKRMKNSDETVTDIASRYDIQEVFKLSATSNLKIAENRDLIHDGENLSANYKITMQHLFGELPDEKLKKFQLLIKRYPEYIKQIDTVNLNLRLLNLIYREDTLINDKPLPNIAVFIHLDDDTVLNCNVSGYYGDYNDVKLGDNTLQSLYTEHGKNLVDSIL